eukprot:3243184-Rhodomonas_salina.1
MSAMSVLHCTHWHAAFEHDGHRSREGFDARNTIMMWQSEGGKEDREREAKSSQADRCENVLGTRRLKLPLVPALSDYCQNTPAKTCGTDPSERACGGEWDWAGEEMGIWGKGWGGKRRERGGGSEKGDPRPRKT